MMTEQVQVGDRFVFSALDEQTRRTAGRTVAAQDTKNGRRAGASAILDGLGSGSGIRTHDPPGYEPDELPLLYPATRETVKEMRSRVSDAASIRPDSRRNRLQHHCCAWRRAGQAIRPLVRLSCTRYRASTCRLSNGSSSRGFIRSMADGKRSS